MKMTSQKPLKHEFARILGKAPFNGSVKCEHHASADALLGAFGPPELKRSKKSTLVFWNFIRDDNARHFSLVVRVEDNTNPSSIPVRVVAKSGELTFRLWTLDRLGAIENGELPMFVGDAGAFAIAHLS